MSYEKEIETVKSNGREKWTAGVALIVIGIIALAGQFVPLPNLGLLVLPALGLVFLLWGILSREGGLLIPGGILSGIGLGVVLTQTIFSGFEEGEATAAVFLLSFALGWGLITLLSAIFTDETYWWALIPGAIMALIGGALLAGGLALQLVGFAGRAWPVALIAVGLYLIFKRQAKEA